MFAGRHEPRDVGHVGHHERADLVGDRPDAREIKLPRIGAGADDDELGPMFGGQARELVVVDALVRSW